MKETWSIEENYKNKVGENKTNKRMKNLSDLLVKRKEDQRTKHGGGKMW